MTNTPLTARAADCAGVTVVVDFRSLGGGVQTGCAPGDPSSGTAALAAAGFGYTFASRQPGFVCRINGKPSGDPCVTTSPATAHWAYWHGRPGGSWTYSSAGAGSYDPAPGSVEGWSFGAGEQPGIAPPAPAPKPVQPAPPPPAPAQPAPNPAQPAPDPGQPAAQPGQPAPAPATVTSTSTSTAETTTTPPTSAETVAGSTTSGPTTTAAQPSTAAEPPADSGGTVGLVIGIVVIAALAGLGGWTARRRAKAAE
ncbi:hypothetical protein B0I31_102502 [Saccharothrix carnea]|uniref:MYXO-CTERM domain-containing protein n=1 Tax=Saccharothrix carnea TaxID=1280637 RepID=A0A2P8IGC7_SACCR|nr:hypothetical protein [Saccharothrix carnea]PSL57523.1 hypothetical protein B0I31_102502 [Saccharothrix carnea]